MVPFSHSLRAVNLGCDWLLFEGSQPRRALRTKIACDYRPCLKVNIGALSSWSKPAFLQSLWERIHLHCDLFFLQLDNNQKKLQFSTWLAVGVFDSTLERCIVVCRFVSVFVFVLFFNSFEVRVDDLSLQALNGHSFLLSVCLLSWSLSQLITQPALTHSVATMGTTKEKIISLGCLWLFTW